MNFYEADIQPWSINSTYIFSSNTCYVHLSLSIP